MTLKIYICSRYNNTIFKPIDRLKQKVEKPFLYEKEYSGTITDRSESGWL